MIHLEVAVAAPLNRTLTYALPTAFDCQTTREGNKYIGRRILVPLSGRRVTGYILSELKEEETEFKVRNITKLLDERPLFHKNQIPFFRWVSNYYHYPLGLVIKTALPGGLAPRSVKKLVLNPNYSEMGDICNVNLHPWLRRISEKGELSFSETRSVMEDREKRKLVRKLIRESVLQIDETMQTDGTQEKNEVCYSFSQPLGFYDGNRVGDNVDFNEYRKILSNELGLQLKISETKAIFNLNALCKRTGYNKISLDRRTIYNIEPNIVNKILVRINDNYTHGDMKKVNIVYWCLPLYNNVKQRYDYNGIDKYIPKYIVQRLKKMKK